MPMENILLLAKPKALGVCPCRIYYFWQNWGHWACVHAEFITIGRTEGIGRVPMRIVSAGTQGKGGGGAWGRRERRDGRCAHRGVATSSPARPGRPYPVRPVESAPGTQTPDTRHHHHRKRSCMERIPSSPWDGSDVTPDVKIDNK